MALLAKCASCQTWQTEVGIDSCGRDLQVRQSHLSVILLWERSGGAVGERHLYQAPTERNSQKTVDEIGRDWFQRNICWQP